MTPKERTVMQQALEFLESVDFVYPTELKTALREALEKQAEQNQLADASLEPVAWMSPNKERLEFSRKDTVYGSHTIPLYTAPVQQAEQEPVGRWNWNEAKFEWLTKFDYYKHHMTPLYAAPVRTKDLTDDEIEWLVVDTLETWNSKDTMKDFARAVIEKVKEKNK